MKRKWRDRPTVRCARCRVKIQIPSREMNFLKTGGPLYCPPCHHLVNDGESTCENCGATEGLTTFSVPGFKAWVVCDDAEACLNRWDFQHRDRGADE